MSMQKRTARLKRSQALEDYQKSPEGLGNFDDTREWEPRLGLGPLKFVRGGSSFFKGPFFKGN